MTYADDVADAAIRAAEREGRAVGALSLAEIAAAAGTSRSTLLRRVGGREAIDDALRRRGTGPLTLAERAVEAAGRLIVADGLGNLTLERVAAAAGCTVMSIHNQIGGRDALLIAVFDHHAVLPRFAPLLDDPAAAPGQDGAALRHIAEAVFRRLLDLGLDRSSVATALMTEALARPDSALAGHIRDTYIPHSAAAVDAFLAERLPAELVRAHPPGALLAQFLGPVQFYVEVATVDQRPRPAQERAAVAAALAAGFVRATTPPQQEDQR
ncbi:hypothetical protein ACFO4E_07795 [Nocardiopsis mangrovi]|uniref:TetR family transcriptional regulator n=1 Tax=Nocardiopsis mangrovi TaxID=1179818 RepID=A0ABV9DSS3_9ACTN